MSTLTLAHPADCPNPELLRQFCVGKLAPRLLEVIADHVAGCHPCRGFVDAFPEDSDALISYLRACAHDRTSIDDPASQVLASRAKAIRVQAARPHVWETPLTLPGYAVEAEVGTGPHGTLYRARHEATGQRVAVKRLLPGLRAVPERLQAYRALAAVEAVATPDGFALVSPWVEGCHLGRVIADRKAVRRGRARADRHPWAMLDEAEYLQRMQSCFDRVIEAVAALHRAGLVHGGIKPTNILVEADGTPHLSDACCRLLDGRDSAGPAPPAYLSPEHWDDPAALDARSDVFSLGAVLYQALTLELPFGSRRVRPGEAAPLAPRYWQPLLAPGLDELLLKALEPYPQWRFRDAAELAEQWRLVRQGKPRPRSLAGLLRRLWSSFHA